MREIDQFEDFFKERFEDFEDNPQPESWQHIQARLQEKRRRPIAIWWWRGAAIAAVLLGLYFLQPLHFLQKNNSNTPTIVNKDANVTKENNLKNTDNIQTNNDLGAENKEENSIGKELQSNKIVNVPSRKIIEINKSKETENITVKNQKLEQRSEDLTVKDKIIIEEKSTQNLIQSQNRNINVVSAIPVLPYRILNIDEQKHEIKRSFVTLEPAVITPKQPKSIDMRLTLNAAPTYNFKNLSPNTEDNIYFKDVKNPSWDSHNRIGAQAELRTSIKYRRIGVFAALNYQLMPFALNYNKQINESALIESKISNSGQSFNISNVSYAYENITEKQNLHSINFSGGLDFYFLKNTRISAGIGTGRWLGKDKLTESPVFATAELSHRFKHFALTPFFRQDLRYYAAKDDSYRFQPYQIGLKIGF